MTGGAHRATPVKYLSVSALGFTTAASIVTSLRGLPMMAKEEMTMFFYIGFSTILFLIPAGLVAAELGSAFGKQAGGLYAWISGAFGKKVGFWIIFLSWIQVIVFYPTGMSFAAVGIAFAFDRPDLGSSLISQVFPGWHSSRASCSTSPVWRRRACTPWS